MQCGLCLAYCALRILHIVCWVLDMRVNDVTTIQYIFVLHVGMTHGVGTALHSDTRRGDGDFDSQLIG